MFGIESLLCTIIYPWLTLAEFVRLDSGSSHYLHEEFKKFIQSKNFELCYKMESQAKFNFYKSNERKFLDWICARDAYLAGACLHINTMVLEFLMSFPVNRLPRLSSVTTIRISISSVADWSMLLYLAPLCFPSITEVEVILDVPTKNLFPEDHFLPSLTILARIWNIKSFFVELGYCTFGLTERQEEMLENLLVALGNQLESFCMPQLILLNRYCTMLAQHCPNVRDFFPRSEAKLTAAEFLHACRQHANLQDIVSTGNAEFLITDDLLVPTLPQLSTLTQLYLMHHAVTWLSLTTAVQHCSGLEYINIDYDIRCKFSWDEELGVRCTKMVIGKYDNIGSPAFLTFILCLPSLIGIGLRCLQREAVQLLASQLQLIPSSCQYVLQLKLYMGLMQDVLPLFPCFPNLVRVNFHFEGKVNQSIIITPEGLQHINSVCPRLTSAQLSFKHSISDPFFDSTFEMIVRSLTNLTRISICKKAKLSIKSLVALAMPGKVWKYVHCQFNASIWDLVECIEVYGLRVQELQCSFTAGGCCKLKRAPYLSADFVKDMLRVALAACDKERA
ncbi:hypothetical protein EON65_27515 [archaeon]|nr:MAG: hypothetical protein EON65_27515 [archaeon]